MRRIYNLLPALALSAALWSGCNGQSSQSAQTVVDKDLMYADPTIILHDGEYYAAGTRHGSPEGFIVMRSDDLLEWTPITPDTLPNLTPDRGNIFGNHGFWAPQFVVTDSCVYMFYTADEQIAFAKADSIGGLYTGSGAAIDDSEKNIDPFLFTDTDGRHYLYHVRFDHGNWLWVGEFDFNTGSFVEGTLQPVFRNDQQWEHTLAYDSAPIMEGPTVVKLDDTYYIFYSANHFMSPDYAVGYATAPSPLGPWTKNPANPIIHRNIVGENGSGHGDLFADKDGNLRYIYHVHNNDSLANPRRSRIITLNIDHSSTPAAVSVDTTSILHPRVR